MAVVNDRVMKMVREEIEKRPDVTSPELFEKAKKLDRGIRSLSARQFNATYPLQIRRSLAPRRRRARPRAQAIAETGSRDRVRHVLLDFARAVAGAKDPGSLVEVIGSIDAWVERVSGTYVVKRPRKGVAA